MMRQQETIPAHIKHAHGITPKYVQIPYQTVGSGECFNIGRMGFVAIQPPNMKFEDILSGFHCKPLWFLPR